MEEEETILERLFPAVFTISIYVIVFGSDYIDKHTYVFFKRNCRKLIKKRPDKKEQKSIWFCYENIKNFLIAQKNEDIDIWLIKKVVYHIVKCMAYSQDGIKDYENAGGEKSCVCMLYNMITSMRATGQITSFAPSSGISTDSSDHILRACVDYLAAHGENRETLEKMVPYAMDINYY